MSVYKKILGMDKLPSYDGFSIIIINDGIPLIRKDAVAINEVANLANQYGVNAIAIDNIYEIGTEGEIRNFACRLHNAELVQVTGSPASGFTSLSLIGKMIGMTSGEKLNPSKSAEVCAIALAAGIGCMVKTFDPETRVSISKRRKPGTGGMSAGRYQRSVQGAVLNLTNRIKASLSSKGIDFDLSFKKGSHGIDGSCFNVYSPRTMLYGLVRSMRTSSINVRVTPVYSKTFEFEELGKGASPSSLKYLIVGVDPGMVTGLAIMDLNGRIVHLSSGRGVTRGAITRIIASLGRALVFASDVNPPPFMVTKLASSHNTILFSPERSMKTYEKSELAERSSAGQNVKAEDTHQRDSLAAASKAFSSYRNKLEQCVSHARERPTPVQLDEVKASVIRGMSINDALAMAAVPLPEPRIAPKPFQGSKRERIKVLETKLEDAKAENDALRGRLAARESDIDELRNQLRLAKLGAVPRRSPDSYEFERRIRSLSNEVASLRAELEGARYVDSQHVAAIERLASGGWFAVKRSASLTASTIGSPDDFEGERIVSVTSMEHMDDQTCSALKDAEIAAVIVESMPSAPILRKTLDCEILIISLNDLSWEGVGKLLVIEKASMEKALASSRSAVAEHFKSSPKRVRQLFDEYKKERWR